MDGDKKTEANSSTRSAAASDVGAGTHEAVAAPPSLSLGRRILYHLWDADQHLKSPQERALVRKLDFGILICATLGWVGSPQVYRRGKLPTRDSG